MRRTSTLCACAPAALLVAEGRQPPLHLRDRAVDRRQVLGRAARQGAVEVGQRAGGGQGRGALDQVALELAAQVALEAVELVAVDRRQLLAAVLGRLLGPGREAERAADPLHVDADHAGALALAAEGGDRQPRQVAHLVLVAVEDRLADLLAQLVDVEPLAALVALGPPRRCPARSPRPRRRGRTSARRAARRAGGRPGTWRSSPPAPRGSRPARSRGPVRARRRRRGSPRCPTAIPSLRSSSQKPSSFGASPGGPASGLGP